MRVGLRKCDTVVHFEARGREQGKGTIITTTGVPVDRGGWKRGVPALQLCHSGAGVKDTQNVNVVGTKIHCKNCVFVQCVCLNCDTVAHVLGNV